MSSKLVRIVSVVVLVGVTVLVAGLFLRTSVTARGGQTIHIESLSWGLSQGNYMRICMGNTGATSSERPIENISLVFTKIQTASGDVILERSLSVPEGQFRCTDFSYSELLTAGLVPEASTRFQFLVSVGLSEAVSVGGAQSTTVGSVETITVVGGRTEVHKTIQTRQMSVVQDL